MRHFVDWRVRRSTQWRKPKSVKEKSKLLLLSKKRAITTASDTPPLNHFSANKIGLVAK